MAKKKETSTEEELSADDLRIVKKKKTTKKKTTKKSSSKKTTKKEKSTKKTTKKSTSKTTKKKTTSKKIEKTDFIQSSCNVGLVGHVDHGKTTLVKALSGTWTEKYSDEINRGITIKLGYAEAAIAQCPNPNCNLVIAESVANNLRKSKKDQKGMCPNCGTKLNFKRRISFVDAPGHEILMATMLSGASLMDGALLLIAANEVCPQPQTREHLAALGIAKIENIIIVQNKIDSISKEKAIEHYNQIKEFVKGTIAENAPIIPTSAIFNSNIDIVSQKIEELIPSPELDDESDFLFNIARSFDVNRPGSEIESIHGGVIGGSIITGKINMGEEIEIRPGYRSKEGKYSSIITTIESIYEGSNSLSSANPGGLIAIGTKLDPSLTRSDQLIGNVAGKPGTLPEVQYTVEIEAHLLKEVLGAEEKIPVTPILKNELIMIVVGTSLSAGVVEKIGKKNTITLKLKRPICALDGSIVALSRRIKNRFRLIGYGYLIVSE